MEFLDKLQSLNNVLDLCFHFDRFVICICAFTQQQNNFERLLNWFSFDWYDDTNEERKNEKMNWRILYLEMIKKRAKARLHGKLNKVKKSQSKENKDLPIVIPWDAIIPVIFLLTCYGMEIAAIKFSTFTQFFFNAMFRSFCLREFTENEDEIFKFIAILI